MASTLAGVLALNAGEISKFALARIDLKKSQVACEVQSNFLPRVLGPCELRPGTQALDRVRDNSAAKLIEFYFDEVTKDLLVLTPGIMQIVTNDVFLIRLVVTAQTFNGSFTTDLSGWTDADEAGATSQWNASPALGLIGTGTNYARRDQLVVVHETGIEHALKIDVAVGNVLLQVGTSAGDTTYLEATLGEGWHSLAFSPTGDFWIRLGANQRWEALVRSIAVETDGRVEVITPWLADDLSNIFYDQSQDVIFVACLGLQQYRIERRSQRSWSVVRYYAEGGPFRLQNLTDITLAPDGFTGSVTIVSSRPFFKNGHVRALFQITHQGQRAFSTLAGGDQFTQPVRVSGLKALRDVSISLVGTFVATVTLQQSIATPDDWTDLKTYTTATTETYNDALDNQIIYYRLGIKGGDYSSGSVDATLVYAGSIQIGLARVTQVVNDQTVYAMVLKDFGKTDATTNWSEGAWSDYRGWPAAVAFHDGRLFWGQAININGSESDAYASYDPTVIGDAGPIARSVATGGRDGIRWLVSLQRLIAGTAQREISIRSDAFDAPLTPTAFVARDCSTRGAARVRPLKIDTIGAFVGVDSQRIFKLVWEGQFGEYRAHELTRLKQEMCEVGVVDCAVQRNPDTRLWYVLADGRVAVLTYDEEDDVAAWTEFVIAGWAGGDRVERVAVLTGSTEDEVYFVVKRVFSGATNRFIERLARRNQCQAGTLNRTSDCHFVYSGAAISYISVPHLANQSVVVWADGAPRVTLAAPVVADADGLVTIPGAAVSSAVIGLAYTGKIKTAKLAYGAEHGTALTMPKKIARVGLVMKNVAWQGVRIGREFGQLVSLPATYRGRPLATGEILTDYDDVPGPFNGSWHPDSRVCLEIASPYSGTIQGLSLDMDTNETNGPPPPPPGRQQG